MRAVRPKYKRIAPTKRVSKTGRKTSVRSHVRNVARRKK